MVEKKNFWKRWGKLKGNLLVSKIESLGLLVESAFSEIIGFRIKHANQSDSIKKSGFKIPIALLNGDFHKWTFEILVLKEKIENIGIFRI